MLDVATLPMPMTMPSGGGTDGMTAMQITSGRSLCFGLALLATGCAQTSNVLPEYSVMKHSGMQARSSSGSSESRREVNVTKPAGAASEEVSSRVDRVAEQKQRDSRIQLVSAEVSAPQPAPAQPNEVAAETVTPPLLLDDVLHSVIASYPLLQAAYFERNIAQGELLQANGEFDLKLKADTLNMPLGFYENYRHSVGAEQPLFGGGTVFGGYRRGTGDFPTYYGERVTKLGGEFKAGVAIPLLQNRAIDDRRAGVWRSTWEVQSVEPEIQAQLIAFIQDGSIAYWNWVAAGQNVRVAEELLKNATERNEGLKTRVKKGDAPEIELTDNERLIVSRRTKLIDARRKLQQSAFKLSLFIRDANGQPVVIENTRLPRDFPPEDDPNLRSIDGDLQAAVSNRPELRVLSIKQEQLNIDYLAAQNLTLPQLDAVVTGSQDVGSAADPKKDDKSPFELEGGVVASVPLQRRKALGKSQQIEGKIAQLRAKTQFTQEKIVAEVQSASAALHAAYQQLGEARRSLELSRQMEAAERRKFDLGDSNLLLVNLREQATADAASTLIDAHLNYFDAAADYRAALGGDVVPQ